MSHKKKRGSESFLTHQKSLKNTQRFCQETDIAMENHHFQWVNQLFLWPFLIAMLNYQMVYPINIPLNHHKNPIKSHKIPLKSSLNHHFQWVNHGKSTINGHFPWLFWHNQRVSSWDVELGQEGLVRLATERYSLSPNSCLGQMPRIVSMFGSFIYGLVN